MPNGLRPKTISGGGEANDLSDFNTSLRQNKIISSIDSRGEGADVRNTFCVEVTEDNIILVFFKISQAVMMYTAPIWMVMNT